MPHQPPLPKAPLPTRIFFDPFNSSSTGHQRAENRLAGSTSWRESRSYKLTHQLGDSSGRGGSQHLADLVVATRVSYQKDGRREDNNGERVAQRLKESGLQDIRGLMSGSRKRKSEDVEENDNVNKKTRMDDRSSNNDTGTFAAVKITMNSVTHTAKSSADVSEDPSISKPPPQIFRGLNIYLNGSTAPEVSDHKLKRLFIQHGGNSSLALGRRTVTHVILGKTCGGGLASSKIHKEVTKVGGKGIKYVTAQWVLDSVEKGMRQPEGQYMPVGIAKRIGGSKQDSVKSMFAPKPNAGKDG